MTERLPAASADRGDPRKDFVRYEVVQTTETHPTTGVHRYHVYGFRENGLRVGLDYLYLRDHDVQVAALIASVEQLRDGIKLARLSAEADEATIAELTASVEALTQENQELRKKLARGDSQ